MTTIEQTQQAQQTWNNWPLTEWLHTVKARQYTIRFEGGLPHLAPTNGQTKSHPVIRDYHFLRRHAHALHLAAEQKHPDWWAFCAGISEVPPSIEQIPSNGDSFACATCGQPADRIDGQALAWCPNHREPELT